jgi:hypothetical protein
MKKLTPDLKRRITADWQALFPQMGVYESLWLARRVGPLVQGVCLDRDSGNISYFPTTHLHNLCRNRKFLSLSLGQRLLSKRSGTQERIAVQFHEQHYREAAQRLAQASLLPLTGDLSLQQVLDAYCGYEKLNRPDSKYPVPLFEDGVLLCAWCGHIDKAMALLREHVREMHDWPTFIMATDGGVTAWESKMLGSLNDPNAIRAIAEAQAQELRINNLPIAALNPT